MNKRYLGIGLFLGAASLYSLFRLFQNGFTISSLFLVFAFAFLAAIFIRNAKS